jgi:hypothetical protein
MNFEDSIKEAISFFENIESILFEITNEKDTQDFLIDTLQDQLFTTGEDGDGVSLGDYSPITIKIKKRKGQPTDRITLKDTGAFYNSYLIETFKGGFFIEADGKKKDTDLFLRYGDNILKPNQQSLILISDFYKERLHEYFINIFN